MKPPAELGTFSCDFIHRKRFRFFTFTNVFSENSYVQLMSGFEELDWEEKRSDFFSQYSATIAKSDPSIFATLYNPAFFIPFREELEKLLNTNLRNVMVLKAHKLTGSQQIGIHNDYCDPSFGYENYRFIFQFSNTNTKENGGELTFYATDDGKEVIKKIPHRSNRGVCFEITPYSFHSVAPIIGERYTLVMYLWDTKHTYDGSGNEIG